MFSLQRSRDSYIQRSRGLKVRRSEDPTRAGYRIKDESETGSMTGSKIGSGRGSGTKSGTIGQRWMLLWIQGDRGQWFMFLPYHSPWNRDRFWNSSSGYGYSWLWPLTDPYQSVGRSLFHSFGALTWLKIKGQEVDILTHCYSVIRLILGTLQLW